MTASENPTTLEELQTLLEELFPVQGKLRSMELADPPAVRIMPHERGAQLCLNLRLVRWERRANNKRLTMRDIREQEQYLGPPSLLQHGDRLEAFLRGSCAALQIVFEANSDDLETLMPHDLWRTEVLKLVRPQTADDFQRALLVRSRLGRYVRKTRVPPRS